MNQKWILAHLSLILVLVFYCTVCSEEKGDSHPGTWKEHILSGQASLQAKQYDRAETSFRSALEIAEKSEIELKGVCSSLYWLSQTYEAQFRYAEALPFLKRACNIAEKAFEHGDINIIICLGDLANLHSILEEFSEAEAVYQRLLKMLEKLYGTENHSVAQVVDCLAKVYHQKGNYVKAESLYKRVLKIRKKIYGKNNLLVASSLNNLGGLYIDTGKYIQANRVLKQAIGIYANMRLPPGSIISLPSLINLARLRHKQGKNAEAETLYKKAVKMIQGNKRADKSSVIVALNALGEFYLNRGKYEAAELMYTQALRCGKGKINVLLGSQLDLVKVYEFKKSYAKAEPLIRESLTFHEKAFGAKHPKVARVLMQFASVLRGLGRQTEATEMEARATGILKEYKMLSLPKTKSGREAR